MSDHTPVNEPETEPTVTDELAALLRDFRQRREQFRIFEDFEKSLPGLRGSVEKTSGTEGVPLKIVAHRLFRICVDAFFLIQVCEWKMNYIAEALLHSIEVRNPISLACNGRALLEHLGAMAFVVESLDNVREGLEGQGSEVKISEALGRAETTLNRAYYGKSPKISEKEDSAPHVESECLAALETFLPDIGEIYGSLCEYVHPNYGSNLLVSTGELGKGRLNPSFEYHKETFDRICGVCSSAMSFLSWREMGALTSILHLEELGNRCLLNNAKVSNAFAKRGTVPQGDGVSKETAFSFKNARTAMEAMELAYSYLRESGWERTGMGKFEAGQDGFDYNLFPTTGGNFWFKIPSTKPRREPP